MKSSNTDLARLDEKIVLGWRVARDLKVEWWDHSGGKVLGQQPDNVLEFVPKDAVATHTAIIAPSGSGKSFFVGRYIEEVVLKTRANVTIFDPNADFRRIAQVDDTVWKPVDKKTKKPRDLVTTGAKRDPLTHEPAADAFAAPWSQVQTHVTGKRVDVGKVMQIAQATFEWSALGSDLLSLVGDGAVDHNDIYALHEYVLARDRFQYYPSVRDAPLAPEDIKEWLDAISDKAGDREEDKVDTVWLKAKRTRDERLRAHPPVVPPEQSRVDLLAEQLKSAAKHATRTDKEARGEYFKRYQTLHRRARLAAGVTPAEQSIGSSSHICVVDLPSFEDVDDRDMVVLFMLDNLWRRVRDDWARATHDEAENETRAPRIIVVDEAHNLIPADQPPSRLRQEIKNRFKTIAGEGRKYGLFLVLVTQRPDKIDPQVLSECGNQAIMLMRSAEVLDSCRRLMGIDLSAADRQTIAKRFSCGFARLSGIWSPEPRVIFAAARRTKQGGADLSDRWKESRSSGTCTAAVANPTAGGTDSANSTDRTLSPAHPNNSIVEPKDAAESPEDTGNASA